MKQKYVIIRSHDKKQLIIKEFAELDKDAMSLLCEEAYDAKAVESAMKLGKEALIGALRTPNMYPAKTYADKISELVTALFKDADQDTLEVVFDDFDFMTPQRKKAAEVDDTEEEEAEDIDELLEDEFEDEFDQKNTIEKLDPSITVDDEDISEFDGDK